MQELYSSNSSLTVRLRWSSPGDNMKSSDVIDGRLFTYPAPFSETVFISNPELSPFDGFFVPDTPIIASWNYDRLLRRLHRSEPDG